MLNEVLLPIFCNILSQRSECLLLNLFILNIDAMLIAIYTSFDYYEER